MPEHHHTIEGQAGSERGCKSAWRRRRRREGVVVGQRTSYVWDEDKGRSVIQEPTECLYNVGLARMAGPGFISTSHLRSTTESCLCISIIVVFYTGTKRSTFSVDTSQWGRTLLLQDLYRAYQRYYFPKRIKNDSLRIRPNSLYISPSTLLRRKWTNSRYFHCASHCGCFRCDCI